jgi:hypothetical protein
MKKIIILIFLVGFFAIGTMTAISADGGTGVWFYA